MRPNSYIGLQDGEMLIYRNSFNITVNWIEFFESLVPMRLYLWVFPSIQMAFILLQCLSWWVNIAGDCVVMWALCHTCIFLVFLVRERISLMYRVWALQRIIQMKQGFSSASSNKHSSLQSNPHQGCTACLRCVRVCILSYVGLCVH